ncbi:MAG: imidazole glycerol phosphate synthase subunit HisH [Pseudomonadota bacterium]
MHVVVIDYGSGNLRSVAKAVERAAQDGGLRATITVTADPSAVGQADRVILPGQGAFADCRAGLMAVPGLVEALHDHVTTQQKPLFGICVGMQLFADEGHEHGQHPGFSWIEGVVDPITDQWPGAKPALKIPHMGWNSLRFDQADHPVLAGVEDGDHVYFAHSYAMRVTNPDDCLAHIDYGAPLTAMVGRGVIVGTQFHPEKSQATGLRLLQNFLAWRV